MNSEQKNSLEKVDLVYLWCDGRDPSFVKEKQMRLAELKLPYNEDNIGDKRYVEHDELRYSLRSAYENVPWINHIYIITDRQRPSWLKSHPKITIVDHREIIPHELLPTFSAIVIEMYIDKIPGLSEKFLLANDDMFFARKLSTSDFFSDNGKPIVWLSPKQPMNDSLADSILSSDRVDWHKTLVRAWALYKKHRELEIPFYTPAHCVDAYCKSIYSQILEEYPELKLKNSQPLRTGEEITRILFSYEMITTYGASFVLKKRNDFLSRVKAKFVKPVDYVAISRESVKKIQRDIRIFNPKTFCLNNIRATEVEDAKRLFNSLWPVPAPWEK